MLNQEEVEVQLYVKIQDHPISMLAVRECMDYLFHCYLTQRYFLKLVGRLEERETWDYPIYCAASCSLVGKFEVPLSIDEHDADAFFKLQA